MLLLFGYQLALFWVLGSKWRWRCPTCGQIADRRSVVGRVYFVLFWISFGLLCLFAVFAIGALLLLVILDSFNRLE